MFPQQALLRKKRRVQVKFRDSVCFDDVLLVPKKSNICSRQEIDLSTSLGSKSFRLPIISSPMDTVTESAMALALFRHGGLGVIHRYNSVKEQCGIVEEVVSVLEDSQDSNLNNVSAAIGVTNSKERALSLYGSGVRILCVDVAHGHHSLVESCLKSLKDIFAESVTIIAGNVATAEAYKDLSSWGADAIRVGIGGGSICSTRIQTGHGVPTLQSVLDCRDADDAALIADGGIKTAGDIVKSLAAGADMVMLGSMLAGTDETPGQIFQANNNKSYKVYRGMASPEAQISWRGEARSLEGVSTTIPYKGEVDRILLDLSRNIKSGLSYSGAQDLRDLRVRSEFIRQTSSGLSESNTHILLSHGR